MKSDEFYALPENQRPWPAENVIPPKGRSAEPSWQWTHTKEWERCVKAMFMLKVDNWLSGAAIFFSERDLEKLTERATEIVAWFQERGSSCRVRISQGDYGWLQRVREVECCVYGENVVKVMEVTHGELHLT